MGHDANLEPEYIDDLDVDQLRIVLSREFLRAIGLRSITIRDTISTEAQVSHTPGQIWLVILRALLTAINETNAHQCKSAMLQLTQTVTSQWPATKPDADDIFRQADFLARFLSMRIADLRQNHFDRVDQEEILVNELHLLLSGPDKFRLRYAHDDLVIMVPPADQTYSVPLWADEEATESEPNKWNLTYQPYQLPLLASLKKASPHWYFWREWYQGFLDGKPLDWELQRRVALIPDEDWEKGPEHIARKIEEIRSEFEAEQRKPAERHEELEPSSVEHLLTAPLITANQIDAAAQDIRDAECKYLNDTGANALPEEFQNFPSIAYSLSQISQSIRHFPTTSSAEDDLRQQIGQLNARIIELETELDTLRSSKDPVFLNAFKEQAGKSLGDWKMYGAVIGAVWLISGDTVGMKARLENLGAALDAIFGTARPVPVAPIGTLPSSTDI